MFDDGYRVFVTIVALQHDKVVKPALSGQVFSIARPDEGTSVPGFF
jgi:hypothetical protein